MKIRAGKTALTFSYNAVKGKGIKMTGSELYNKTLALINEAPEDYNEIVVQCINTVLSETFRDHNFILKGQKNEPLTEIPIMENLDEEIPYIDELVNVAFPYGLASYIIYDDDDMNKVQFWYNRYILAVQSIVNKYAYESEIEDVYRHSDSE